LVSKVVLVVAVAALIALAGVAALLGGRGAPPNSTSLTTTSSSSTSMQGFSRGLSFSPLTTDSAGINDFFSKAAQGGSVVEWAGDWEELGGASPGTVVQLASQHVMKAMVVVQFFSQSSGALLRPLNSTNEQHYLDITRSFVAQYKPAYFGIGIEVNILYEANQTAFNEFVKLYSQAYDAVKASSPGTTVFTIFQLEKMEGMGGGLYGGVNDPGKSEWQLISDFPKDDVLAFTTYPSLVFHTPAEIPSGYYSGIPQHSDKPVGFTEVGWHTGGAPGGWNGSEAGQSQFVSLFLQQAKSLPAAFAVWSFLYDPAAQVPFNSMGMFYDNGTQKSAWQGWSGS